MGFDFQLVGVQVSFATESFEAIATGRQEWRAGRKVS